MQVPEVLALLEALTLLPRSTVEDHKQFGPVFFPFTFIAVKQVPQFAL
jgi:hypothetical protein